MDEKAERILRQLSEPMFVGAGSTPIPEESSSHARKQVGHILNLSEVTPVKTAETLDEQRTAIQQASEICGGLIETRDLSPTAPATGRLAHVTLMQHFARESLSEAERVLGIAPSIASIQADMYKYFVTLRRLGLHTPLHLESLVRGQQLVLPEKKVDIGGTTYAARCETVENAFLGSPKKIAPALEQWHLNFFQVTQGLSLEGIHGNDYAQRSASHTQENIPAYGKFYEIYKPAIQQYGEIEIDAPNMKCRIGINVFPLRQVFDDLIAYLKSVEGWEKFVAGMEKDAIATFQASDKSQVFRLCMGILHYPVVEELQKCGCHVLLSFSRQENLNIRTATKRHTQSDTWGDHYLQLQRVAGLIRNKTGWKD